MTEPEPYIEHFTVGAFACTCTIIVDPQQGEAIVIDPGDEADRIIAWLTARTLRVRTVLHTHAHIDHLGATHALCEQLKAEAALHPGDLPLAAILTQQAAMLQLRPVPQPKFSLAVHDGDSFRCGAVTIHALHTPGHTPGSMSFACELAGTPTTLLTGDTLFAGGVGRWDLGGTSLADIIASIRRKLLIYPDESIIVPGHGSRSTIGTERRTNPYLLT